MSENQHHHHHGRDDDHGRNEGRGHGNGRDKEITIIVNGREKTVTERKLNMDDLVKLAFENPPTGEFICFTITYRRGESKNPQGTLEEGETVTIKKGMIFNVTATDKS